MLASLAFLVLPARLVARDIVFPPVAPLPVPPQAQLVGSGPGQYRSSASRPDHDAFLDFEKYSGLTTFSNLPWVHCLSSEDDLTDKYDIAFLGAPFDTATTGRPGARFGPGGIRR